MPKKEDDLRRKEQQRRAIYIALEEVDLTWSVLDVIEIRQMWEAGICLTDIARKMKRQPDELALLIFDQAMQGKIQARPGGVFGHLVGPQQTAGKGARIEEILLAGQNYGQDPNEQQEAN